MKFLIKLILAILLICSVLIYGSYLKLNAEVKKELLITSPTTFTVNSGQSFRTVSLKLQDQGIIADANWIYWYSRINKLSHKIKAGEYTIPTKISSIKLINLLIKGKVKQYSFTIIEGWSFKELIAKIQNAEELENDIAQLTNKNIMAIVADKNLHPEGQFLPDTYLFDKGSKVSHVLKRAHKHLKEYLKIQWKNRKQPTPLKNAYEALILASIVEKETGVVEERPLIAGVFINRLNKKMKLQTDPTVIYGMGDKYKGDIRFRDLRNYTPYNTYKIKALPPTPIAMPGRAAIKAALNPNKTKALYFVAKGKGKHYFSSTLKEHNNAVNKYQRKRNAL